MVSLSTVSNLDLSAVSNLSTNFSSVRELTKVVYVRFEPILSGDTSSCSLLKKRGKLFLSFFNHEINILFGEMTLQVAVSDNDTVGVSGPSRLVRSRDVHNTVGNKYQK